jgi:hypothetical protein
MPDFPRTGMVVTELDDESWPMFVAQRGAVVVLTRNDCQNCEGFLRDLEGRAFSVGVIRLDAPGAAEFKRAYPQISVEASVLPFSILFERGEWVDSLMGARVGSILEWFG